jgi:hypothetical protein
MSIKIYINPGHGGSDPGAVGNNMRESDITLEVSRTLGDFLSGKGIEIRYSRTNDTRPSNRIGAANAWGADYCVSIHVNAAGGTGCETFIAQTKQSDRAFALAVNDTYAAAMGLRNRGVKLDSSMRPQGFGELREARMPAILVELAFIDSPLNNPDVNILRDRRRDMAEALAKGILGFLNIDSDISDLTPISGRSVTTAAQMQSYIRRVNPNVAQSVIDMIPFYISEGDAEGIRGDIAFAQSCIETGNFAFTGGTAVTLSQNNFCGMGVTSLGMRGNHYSTPQQGIRAQIQHLKAYANTEPLRNALVAPTVGESRFRFVQRGIAPHVEWLGIQENPQSRGWAAGAGYGAKILDILSRILNTQSQNTEELTMSQYNELKTAIAELNRRLDTIFHQWGYMTDADFPERLKPIVQRLYDSGSDFRLPNGSLGISRDIARMLIALDDLGFFK